jgi:hypothetical protein
MDSYAAEFEAQREDEVSRRHVASVAEEVANALQTESSARNSRRAYFVGVSSR